MNYYIVTEGKTEKKVYKKWITYVNSSLTYVDSLDQLSRDNFYIVSSSGYPAYYNTIKEGLETCLELNNVDCFVIVLDSEDFSFDEKLDEVNSELDKIKNDLKQDFTGLFDIKIIVQHCCIETWGLANKRIFPTQNINSELNEYRTIFNVKDDDPEHLPSYPEKEWNRANFALNYLKCIILARTNYFESYSKRNPNIIMTESYFNEIKSRYEQHSHIQSFSYFLSTFV